MTGKEFGEYSAVREEFCQYIYEGVPSEGEKQYNRCIEEDAITSAMLALSTGLPSRRSYQEDEALFQTDCRMIEDMAEYRVSDVSFANVLKEGESMAAEAEDGIFLTSETRKGSYFLKVAGEEVIHFIVCCVREGIICKRAGERRAVWKLPYRRRRDFYRVRELFRRFQFQENLRFAVHKNFWQDFLSGNIDREDFLDFFEQMEYGMFDRMPVATEGVFHRQERYYKYFKWNTIASPETEAVCSGGDFMRTADEVVERQQSYALWKQELMELLEENDR